MPRRRFALALPILLLAPAAVAGTPGPIAAAIASADRPADDKAHDAARKPADMLVFAQVKRGETVVDLMPGKGYFTRLFSNAVGKRGTVYAVWPQAVLDRFKEKGFPIPPSVAKEPGHANVHDFTASDVSFNLPTRADIVWTSQNYHDVHIFAGAAAADAINKAAFEALKPGGAYVVLDHSGVKGEDDATMAKLHRIDEDRVKREVVAAGFVLEAESDALRNPADPRTANVFDPAIRGKTDQFVLRFRKPAA
jgi:predicted methyltransferase